MLLPNKTTVQSYIFSDQLHADARPDEILFGHIGHEELSPDGQLISSWNTARLGKPIEVTGKKEDNLYPVFVQRQEVIEAGGIIVPVISAPEEVWKQIEDIDFFDQVLDDPSRNDTP